MSYTAWAKKCREKRASESFAIRKPQRQTQWHSNSTSLECLGTQKPANTDGLPEKKQQEVKFAAGGNGGWEGATDKTRGSLFQDNLTSRCLPSFESYIHTKTCLQMTPPHLPLEALELESSQLHLGRPPGKQTGGDRQEDSLQQQRAKSYRGTRSDR